MNRELFSKWGFILATVGSAVGLGNIWKFPYITGEYGGGAFVLIYLITILLIGVSILIAEMLLGNIGKSDPVTTFEKINPSMRWFGLMAFNGLIIMTFYSVVIGWIFYYIYSSINGLPTTIQDAESEFKTLIGENIETQILFHTFATLIVLHFVNGGIKEGIEKLNKILMPSLMLILFGILIYAFTLPSFHKAFEFLFYPHWEKLTSEALIRAVGHSFFTLSLGMGAIITYSASISNKINLSKTAMIVAFFDTVIALIAGLIIFTFLFQFGEEPSKGAGLVFISMPVIFSQMGDIGYYISILFLSALAMAGLTSAVSLVEPSVLYIVNRFGLSRFKATIMMGSIYWLIGIFAILSYSTTYGEAWSFFGKPLFDIFETTTDSLLLPLSGLIIAFVVGYIISKNDILKIENEMGKTIFLVWHFSIKFIAPIAVIFLMLNLFGIVTL